jgi:uncharacterized cupin superfamily protein
MKQARMQSAGEGFAPVGEGWFVLNAREARWLDGDLGAYTRFEGEARFPQIGVNIGVLQPGQPSCLYHAEDEQEDFLLLSGEALLIIEEEERQLKAWDFVHCPPGTKHVFVGAGSGPCVLLAMGTRGGDDVVYPASAIAQRHGAGVAAETRDPDVAYATIKDDVDAPYQRGWLPGD